MESRKIIFFDGVCNLCNSTVQKIIKADHKNIFTFTSLQSSFAQNFFKENEYNNPDSIIYWNGTRFYSKSTAALKIASQLNLPYSFLCIFFVIPAPVRDLFYTFIARNRYKWFGKQDTCMIPDDKLKNKFIE